MNQYQYTIQCKQADGTTFQPDWRLSWGDAQDRKKEYASVFTRCTGWKVVKVGE